MTIRVRKGTWNLRSQRCFLRIAKAFIVANSRGSNGMRALLISMARRLNDLMEKSGPLFVDRFHERALTSPNAVRTALRYVLTNAQEHHGHELVDPFSSGPWFRNWPVDAKLPRWNPCTGPPTASAESWLLRGGWKRAGAF